jgi:hypothetical protein
MKELGYDISSIRNSEQGLILDCYDTSDKFYVIQTTYRL